MTAVPIQEAWERLYKKLMESGWEINRYSGHTVHTHEQSITLVLRRKKEKS